MKVNYIPNTCDLPDWNYGEQSVVYLDDEILFVYDLSDGFLDIRDSRSVYKQIQSSLETNEEIEFETVKNPPKEVVTALKKHLRI